MNIYIAVFFVAFLLETALAVRWMTSADKQLKGKDEEIKQLNDGLQLWMKRAESFAHKAKVAEDKAKLYQKELKSWQK